MAKKQLRPPPFRNPPPLVAWDRFFHAALTAATAIALVGAAGCIVSACLVGIWISTDVAEQLFWTGVVLTSTGFVLGSAL